MPRPARLAPALLLTATLLVGCGDDSDPADRPALSATEHNDADVAFATDMVPHHAQALQMADLTLGRDLSPEMAALVEDIRAAQAPEIETMVDWLVAWDEPVPETARDHANAGHSGDGSEDGTDHGDSGHDMPGMLSDEDLSELEAARGDAFEDLWLTLMVEHHEGAVEMAERQVAEGRFRPAVELARTIVSAQEAEIEAMEELLAD